MLSTLFTNLDLFGQNIQLNLHKNYKHRTSMGGVISIFMILALAGFLFSKVSSFFEQSEISVNQELTMDYNPEKIKLSPDKFMFAVQMRQEFVDFVDAPIFLITIRQNNYSKNKDPKKKKDKQKLRVSMEPCKVEHWSQIGGKFNAEEEYEVNGFDKWLCPTLGQDFLVGGQFTSDDFNFMRFEIVDCIEDLKDREQYFPHWNYTCATDGERKDQFDDQGDVKFNFKYVNYFVNSQSNEPIQPYLEEMSFSLQPGRLYRQGNIFIQDHTIKTDNKIFPSFSDYIETKTIPILQQSENKEEFLLDHEEGTHARYFLRRSTISINYDRAYMTMSDLLAYIGGSAEIIYLIFAGFALFLNQQHYLISVANSIYNFEENEQDKEKMYKKYKNKKLNTMKSLKSQKSQKSLANSTLGSNHKKDFKHEVTYQKEQIIQQQNQKQGGRRITNIIQDTLGFKSKLDFIIFHLQDYVHRMAKINFSMQYVAFTITGGKAFRTSRNLQLEKAIKLASNQTDLSIILQRLSEIDKLKKILLDREQQRLFDFTPKPLIKVIKENKSNHQLEKVVVQMGQNKNDDYSVMNKSEIKQPKMNKFFSEDQSDVLSEASQKQPQVQNTILRDSLKKNFKTYMLVLEAKTKFMRVIKFRRRYKKQMKDNEIYLNLYQSYLNVAGRLDTLKNNNLIKSTNFSSSQGLGTNASQLQTKINKELISQMGLEMKEIFELSKILEIKYLTKNKNGGLTRSFTGIEQSVTPSQIYSKKEKQVMELSFNGNSTYYNRGDHTTGRINNNNPNAKDQNDELSQFDSCSFDQYINTNRNYDFNERSQINTEREKFKEQMPDAFAQQIQFQQQTLNTMENNPTQQQQQTDTVVVDTSDWALPGYAQKEMNNTKKQLESCRVDSSRSQYQQQQQQQNSDNNINHQHI